MIGMTHVLGDADFDRPIDDRWFEDYHPGSVYEYGYADVTEQAILDFARQFDPQPIHIDPEWARTGPFGGLIASGWHTAGLFTRLYVDHYVSRVASLASPGVDEVRWRVPVRPGDRLRMRVTVLDARPSTSKPDRGIVHTRGELINQNEVTAFSQIAINFFARRQR
jgi:acyl dehydratase